MSSDHILDITEPKEGNCFMDSDKHFEKHRKAITSEQLRQIEEFANSIHFGSITLVFQDGILIQIEKSEKIRIQH